MNTCTQANNVMIRAPSRAGWGRIGLSRVPSRAGRDILRDGAVTRSLIYSIHFFNKLWIHMNKSMCT